MLMKWQLEEQHTQWIKQGSVFSKVNMIGKPQPKQPKEIKKRPKLM